MVCGPEGAATPNKKSAGGHAMAWFAGANKKYLALFENADQDRIRSDLRTFFGPRADYYLSIYEKMRTQASGGQAFVWTWHWSVFLTTFPWFFYRKMYAMGAAVILVLI